MMTSRGTTPTQAGRKSQVCIDYLDLSFGHLPESVIDLLQNHLGEDWGVKNWHFSKKSKSYQIAKGPSSSTLTWRSSTWSTRLTLQGRACSAVGTAELLRLLNELSELSSGIRLRRIDLAFDDHDRFFTPRQIRKKTVQEKVVGDGKVKSGWKDGVHTKAKKAQFYSSNGPDGLLGETFYAGDPKSDRVLAIYDKSVQSNGVVDAIRWELRLRDEWAEAIYPELIKEGVDLGVLWASLIADFFDVRNPNSYSAKHPERRKRMRWFGRIVGSAKRATIRPRRKQVTHKTIENDFRIARQFSRLVTAGVDPDDLLRIGMPRLTAEDLEAARVYRDLSARKGINMQKEDILPFDKSQASRSSGTSPAKSERA